MRNVFILLSIVSIIFLAGCDNMDLSLSGRYSGEKDAAGNFIILDTKTGKIEILNNGILIDIPKEIDFEEVKKYPPQNIPGTPVQIGLQLKFRNGQLLYKGYMKPIIQSSQKEGDMPHQELAELFERMEALWKGGGLYSSREINIQLLDSDGFQIMSFEITRGTMTRTIDQNSNPVQLSFHGSKAISPKDFQSISGYSFSWNLADWKETSKKKKRKS